MPEEPFPLSLTKNEIVALIKYHDRTMRDIPKRLGKALTQAGHTVPGWAAKKAAQTATDLISVHGARMIFLAKTIGIEPRKK